MGVCQNVTNNNRWIDVPLFLVFSIIELVINDLSTSTEDGGGG